MLKTEKSTPDFLTLQQLFMQCKKHPCFILFLVPVKARMPALKSESDLMTPD